MPFSVFNETESSLQISISLVLVLGYEAKCLSLSGQRAATKNLLIDKGSFTTNSENGFVCWDILSNCPQSGYCSR